MKSFFTDFRRLAGKHEMFSLVAMIFCFFLFLPGLSAQGVKENPISINVDNTPIQNVLALIEKQSSYRFIYNSDLKSLQQKVTLNEKSTPIKIVLNDLFNKTDLVYTLMENNMIVVNEIVKNNFADDDRIVNGKVTGIGGSPLSGVSVQIKGSNKGVVTKKNGEYYISVSDSDVLVFSYVGYETQEISVAGKLTINVSLASSNQELTQVVVVGYGTQKKIDVTGSVAHVKGEELVKQPVLTATQAIQGKVAGVQIISSGQPGSSPQVIIRGAGSILGGEDPMYVVDGVILPPGSDITNINTSDIASIDVLKDASSCAIYGARAANGVILITTKQGTGKAKINYSVNLGINQAAYVVPMANASQYLAYREAATGGLPVSATGYNTNWYNEVLRNAFYQNHNISISGSSEKNRYLFAVGYLTDEGIIIANQYNRYTFRLNNEFTPTSFIKIGTTASFANAASQNVPTATITEDAYRAAPTVPAILNGKYGNTSQYQNVGNPVLDAYNTNDLSHDNRLEGNAYIEIKPIKSLTFRSSLGGLIDFSDDRAYTYQHPNDTTFFNVNGGSQGATRSTLNVTNGKNYNWDWDNTISFDKKIGQSRITALIGTTAEEINQTGFSAYRYYVPPIPSEWYLNNGDASSQFNNSSESEETRQSYLGRVFYSYADKYLFTLNFRRDGSSVFAANNRWGNFPGVSGGWVITKEKFMQNQNIFQYLKLRVGWGELGNSSIPSDATVSTLLQNLPYFFNGSDTSGATILQIKDQNIKWEVTKETDIGLEYSVLKGKLTGEIDIYDKMVSNALIPVYVVGTFGSGASTNSSITPGYVITNAATIDNKGLEFSLHWQDKISDKFSYFIGGNVSFNRNRVVSLNGGVPIFDGNINGYFVTETKAGYPIGSFFMRQVTGVIQSGPQAGNFIYKTNASGNIDTTYQGSYQPKAYVGLSGGINYKNFDFSLDIYSNLGNQVYNGKEQARVTLTDNVEESVATSYWTQANKSETQPAANGGNLPASSYFIASGTFVRINNVTVGYTIPESTLSRQKVIKTFRFFVNAQNPITLKKYGGFSSELPGTSPTNSGIELGTYPTIRTFAIGANIGF